MRFERVEYESFSKDMRKWLPVMKDARDSYLAKILNMVTMPRRETKGSAGYDFRLPIPVTIPSGGNVVAPSGIRAVFREDEMDTWHLQGSRDHCHKQAQGTAEQELFRVVGPGDQRQNKRGAGGQAKGDDCGSAAAS